MITGAIQQYTAPCEPRLPHPQINIPQRSWGIFICVKFEMNSEIRLLLNRGTRVFDATILIARCIMLY